MELIAVGVPVRFADGAGREDGTEEGEVGQVWEIFAGDCLERA